MNRIKISQEDKRKLSLLFSYYKESGILSWKMVQAAGISPTVFSEILKQTIKKKDETYLKIIEVSNKQYKYVKGFYAWLHSNLKELNQVLEKYDENQFKSMLEKWNRTIMPFKTSVIFEEYDFAIQCIMKYYMSRRMMTMEEMEKGLKLIESGFFEKTIEIYLMDCIFLSNYNFHGKEEVDRSLLKLIETRTNEPILKRIVAMYEFERGNLIKALEIENELLDYWKLKENNYRIVRVQIELFAIYRNIDEQKADEAANELIHLKKMDEISERTKRSINYNVGMYEYVNKNYTKAKELFLENIMKYNSVKEWSFIGAICTHEQTEIPKEIQDVKLDGFPHKEYIVFYQWKQRGESEDSLIDYIFNELIPYHLSEQEYVNPRWKMFEYEMKVISEKSHKNLKYYKKYLDKMYETVKDA